MPDATVATATIRPEEAAHFAALAKDWWDPKGSSAMLHRMNPVRLGFIREAIDLMQTGRYRNVPVIDGDGRLVGVVRQTDIIKYLAESFPEELLNLPPRPHQRMRAPEGA